MNTATAEKQNKIMYISQAENFSKIPGSPVAYWVNKKVFNIFERSSKISELCFSKTGMTTGDNNKFLRMWFEVKASKVNRQWKFYNKGGGFRRWYGNIDYVINWENDGYGVKNAKCSTIRNEQYYFHKCISWNLISTTSISVRLLAPIFVMGDAGPACYFNNTEDCTMYLALLNSNAASYLLNIINPTINYSCGVMEAFPVMGFGSDTNAEKISCISNECVSISELDWDSFETSWDFKKHPLI